MLSSYPSGTPIVGSDGFPIDFKADSDLQQALNFHLRGCGLHDYPDTHSTDIWTLIPR